MHGDSKPVELSTLRENPCAFDSLLTHRELQSFVAAYDSKYIIKFYISMFSSFSSIFHTRRPV